MSASSLTTLHCDGREGLGCPSRSVFHAETTSHVRARLEAALEGWTYERLSNGKRNIRHIDVCDNCNPHNRRNEDVRRGDSASADA